MAAFLNSELDFIYFFYGLAFLLLASVCFAISKVRGPGEFWMVLGAFAALHGVGEWLDLTALVLADSVTFAVGRAALMTVSFAVLLEFARLRARQAGFKVPGRWIFVPLFLLVLLAGYYGGLGSAQAVARYMLGFTAAGATAIITLQQSRKLTGGWKHWTQAAGVFFGLYAVATGLIVPYAPFWPASVVNGAAFVGLTGVPIQLVRGLIACALSISIWAIWGRLLARDVASERYSSYLRKQFIVALAVLAVIMLAGWLLTEDLGRLYQTHVQEEARGDFDLLSSRVAAETNISQAVARTIAGTPVAVGLLTGGTPDNRGVVTSMLGLAVSAAGATEAVIIDASGKIVAQEKAIGVDGHGDPELTRIGRGGIGTPVHRFAVDPGTGKPAFYTSYPIRTADGRAVGATVLKKTLDALEDDVSKFDIPYYLVDATGRVMLTNRGEALDRQLWPLPGAAARGRPVLQDDPLDGAWINLNGERELVRRGDMGSSGWSLVMITPTAELYASRVLGIVITLLAAISTLTLLVAREHRVRDGVQLDKRMQLQELARSLDLEAGTDPLTGVLNRRKFDLTFSTELMRAERYGTALAVLMLDIDHFKTINDAHGHVAGDRVLIALSRLIADNLRQSDVLARWGGEEFVVLVPGVDSKMAGEVAEKLRSRIAAATFGEAGSATCSFGVAEYRPGDTPETLMKRVDTLLYRAKTGGRNRIEVDAPASPPQRLISAA